MPLEDIRQVTVSYESGESTALAGEGLWLVADTHPADTEIGLMWQRMVAGVPSGEIAEEILGLFSGGHFPRGFVLARLVGDAILVAVAGEGNLELRHGEFVERLTCPESAVIADYRIREIPDALIGEINADPEGALVPFSAGVVSANRLHVAWNQEPTQAVAPSVGPGPEPGKVPGTEPEERVADDTILPFANVGGATLAAPDEAQLALETAADAKPGDSEANVDHIPPAPEEGDSGYDFLFGHTMHRSVGDAAVHPTHDPEPQGFAGVSDDRHSGGSESVPPAPSPRREEGVEDRNSGSGGAPTSTPITPFEPAPIVHAKATGMIDSVPWKSGAGAAGPTDADAIADDAEAMEDGAIGLTISRAKLNQLADEAAAGQSGNDSARAYPAVHAVHCPEGHPNPAHADVCRVCGASVATQMPITLPRPVLGVLRFSTGDLITLDRGVLIGHAPSKARSQGDDRPHVLKIPSPDQDISRDHAEISLADWHVLVTDLNSTNGTVVTRPGREPERLRPDQATQIEPGTVVTLADIVTFTYEATS